MQLKNILGTVPIVKLHNANTRFFLLFLWSNYNNTSLYKSDKISVRKNLDLLYVERNFSSYWIITQMVTFRYLPPVHTLNTLRFSGITVPRKTALPGFRLSRDLVSNVDISWSSRKKKISLIGRVDHEIPGGAKWPPPPPDRIGTCKNNVMHRGLKIEHMKNFEMLIQCSNKISEHLIYVFGTQWQVPCIKYVR